MKRIIYLTCFLAIISMLAGGLLWFVNDITYERINEGKIAAEKENLEKIFPGGNFSEMEFEDETGLIEKVFKADGEGYVYKVNVQGYKDVITFVVGFSEDGKIVGYEVISMNDTPGIGDQVAGDSFKSGVVGKNSNDGISTISGATVSSKAVVTGIDAAKANYNEMMGISGEGSPAEEVKPTLTLGNPVAIEATTFKGEITETTVDGDETTFIVEVNGYGMLEGGGADHGYSRNEYKIVVNTAENQIVSIEYVNFGDTKGFGDKTMNEEYYALFEGLSTTDYSQEVDTVSTATTTSKSMISAIRIVLDALNQ